MLYLALQEESNGVSVGKMCVVSIGMAQFAGAKVEVTLGYRSYLSNRAKGSFVT